MQNNVLLVDPNRLKKESYLDMNVADDMLRIAIVDLQNFLVERVTGSCLFETLREMVCDKSIYDDANQLYARLLDEYIFPIFAYGVPAELNIPLSFKTRNAGVIRGNTDDKTNADMDDVKHLNSYYRNKMDFYVNRAVDFLVCHYDEFPELKNCGCGWCETRGLNKHFSNPLYLGR